MTLAAQTLAPSVVRTVALDDSVPLLDRLPAVRPLAWVRHGEGLVGWGEAARVELTGPGRFERGMQWFQEFIASAVIEDEVRVPGSGPVVFASYAFNEWPARSVLVVPRVVVGRREGRTWLTTVGETVPSVDPVPPARPENVRYADGVMSPVRYLSAVAEGVKRIQRGDVEKIVLARDLVAHTDKPVDVRYLMQELSARYPGCWTFSVDGLVGATPELLVRRMGESVFSLVLAGTTWRHDDVHDPNALAAELMASGKNRREHVYAAVSAVEALNPHCKGLRVPPTPHVLRLANVIHLATEISGKVADRSDALALAGDLHPTAAVCGTPTDNARKLIRKLERFDRGRYAGPVGWVDARGDGEFGIALRCARVEGTALRMYAGCGIVAESDPRQELAESQAKLWAMRSALES